MDVDLRKGGYGMITFPVGSKRNVKEGTGIPQWAAGSRESLLSKRRRYLGEKSWSLP